MFSLFRWEYKLAPSEPKDGDSPTSFRVWFLAAILVFQNYVASVGWDILACQIMVDEMA